MLLQLCSAFLPDVIEGLRALPQPASRGLKEPRLDRLVQHISWETLCMTFNVSYDHLRWCGRDLTLFLDYSSHGIIAVSWELEGFWLKRSPGAPVQGSVVFIFFFRMIRIPGRSRTIQAASVEPEPNIPLSAVTQSYETLPFDPRSCARHIVSLHKASGSSGDISEALWHGGADNRGINRKDLLAGGCSCSYHCPLNLISKA